MRRRKYIKAAGPSMTSKYLLQPYRLITKFPNEESLEVAKDIAYIPDFELSEDRYSFDLTKDVHSAINILVKCTEMGCYPPIEVLTFLSSKFKIYLNGAEDIVSATGLSKSAKITYKNAKRNMDIVVEIDTLQHYFKIGLDEAIELVVSRYENINSDNVKKLKFTTIKKIFNNEGKSDLQRSLMYNHDDIPWADDMSEEFREKMKKDILSKYPDAEIKELIGSKIKMARKK